ncbi:hypothetical protein [Haladaptatus sp. NG-WS-4]
MTTAIRTADEGAWVNVNDTRTVGVSSVWKLADHDVCDCEIAFFLVEVFVEIGVDGRWVDTRVAGQCIDCGERGTTGWLRVGRVADEFRPVAVETVHRPRRAV